MASTREELLEYLETYVKSNGSPSLTRGSDVRAFMEFVIAALVNILDDKDEPDGYLGLDSDGRADPAFLATDTPAGLFLRDDGTFAEILDRLLTDLAIMAGDVTSADTLLEAIGKLQGKLRRTVEITGTSRDLAAFDSYIANNASQVNFRLDAAAAVGDTYKIRGKGAGGWRIIQNANQVIHTPTGSTTVGVSGYLEFSNRYDCVEIECITAPTDFVVVNNSGTLVRN